MSYRIGDRNMPGPGDPETWPACTGHPMDPRSEPREWDDLTTDEKIEELVEQYEARELARMYLKAKGEL